MCKTIKNSFFEKLTFEKLILAYNRAIKNKGNKKEIIKFSIDLESNISNLLFELKTGKYKPSKYIEFTIYEPKERLIRSLPFKDRIVQQWYIEEFIKPYILPRFINTTCACIEKKGNLYAVNLCQKYMKIMKRKNNSYYILKLDIKKFFYNIDKNILYDIMKKYICDKYLLKLTYIFIFDNNDDKGIPIGNYTSQFFANIYLGELDRYIKEILKVKYYIRYMDDMIIMESKEKCIYIKNKIDIFIRLILKLEYNSKSRYYPRKMGVNFCGYRIYCTHKLLRDRSKIKIKKKIVIWNKLFLINKFDENKMVMCFNSWISHAKHCNSYNFRLKIYASVSLLTSMIKQIQ